MAQSVAVAVGGIGDKLVSSLAKKVEALKVGPGLDKQSEMGPLVTKEHLEKVKGYVDVGEKEGAKLVVDGRNFKIQGYEKGYYIGGCLFDHVTKEMRIYKEEIFGPVLSVVRAKNFEEALKLVNDHEFGNGVSIFTRDGDSGRTFSNKAKIGMVGVNIPIPVPIENASRALGLKTKISVKTNRRLKVDFFKSDMINGHLSALFVKQLAILVIQFAFPGSIAFT